MLSIHETTNQNELKYRNSASSWSDTKFNNNNKKKLANVTQQGTNEVYMKTNYVLVLAC